ncbi:MAG TPA: DUF4421 family protein [Bacteroidia bacterium]|nr:DUF4421 family protein [Bacteroidia bacterium]
MHKRYILLLFLVLWASFYCPGQEKKERKAKEKKEHKKKEKKIPENIEAIPAVFAFRPKYSLPSTLFDISNKSGNGLRFNYAPFVRGVVGAGVKIKSVYIAYSIKIPNTTAEELDRGKTSYQDILVTIQTRITGVHLFYQDYKGFYLLYPDRYNPKWTREKVFPQVPSLHIINAGVNLTFVFNPNFSLNAAFAQNERQKKSRGSFMMGISERFTSLSCDTSIVPAGQASAYPTLNKYSSGSFYSSILSLGMGYSFIHRRWNLTPVLLAGSGLQGEYFHLSSGSQLDFRVPLYFNFRTSLGYNGDHFYTNVIFNAELNSISLSETQMRIYHGSIDFGLGIRF